MDFESTSATNILAFGSLITSTIVAILFFIDRRNTKYNIANEYLNQLLTWHTAVIDVLITLRYTSEQIENKQELLLKLSSLIEQGRFFSQILSEMILEKITHLHIVDIEILP
ncbi:hypothetical protein [Janthinobacterium sp. B9-8]|uniref:hypothetical protein n=1 Tax=Janthinobacterium sp. B9-8 TaxID=1236179 RepID=UPI00061CFA6E|nr:hypothetical protein [Janthinobacterium sp. B9-8]AMC35111.1 hypothetical protein VN23_11065 [Janthinobacterium sp. B9-8]